MEQTLAPPPAGRFRHSHLAQAWLVLVLALVFGAALAAVQVTLSPIIAANKMNETLEKVPELVWGRADARKLVAGRAAIDITPGIIEIKKKTNTTSYSLFRVAYQGKPAGWVVKTGGQGYADRIEMLIGFDPHVAAITGLFVIEQKETPGLGAKIISPHWRDQFVGKKTATPLTVVKGGIQKAQDIDALTGATISSRSVVRIVNRTVSDLAGELTPAAVRFSKRKH